MAVRDSVFILSVAMTSVMLLNLLKLRDDRCSLTLCYTTTINSYIRLCAKTFHGRCKTKHTMASRDNEWFSRCFLLGTNYAIIYETILCIINYTYGCGMGCFSSFVSSLVIYSNGGYNLIIILNPHVAI